MSCSRRGCRGERLMALRKRKCSLERLLRQWWNALQTRSLYCLGSSISGRWWLWWMERSVLLLSIPSALQQKRLRSHILKTALRLRGSDTLLREGRSALICLSHGDQQPMQRAIMSISLQRVTTSTRASVETRRVSRSFLGVFSREGNMSGVWMW